MDSKTREKYQIGMDMLYQVDIKDYIKMSIQSKNNLNK